MSRLKNIKMKTEMIGHVVSEKRSGRKKSWKELKRSKKIQYIFLCILVGGLVFNGITRIVTYRTISGQARWIETSGQKYLYVSANTPYDLGYLTGQKLWSQILSLKFILILMCPEFRLSYPQLEQRAEQYLPSIPEEHIEEMHGLADGSTNSLGFPITFNDILMETYE
jgi:hypothetical protein